jgi:hypothetical protein
MPDSVQLMLFLSQVQIPRGHNTAIIAMARTFFFWQVYQQEVFFLSGVVWDEDIYDVPV